MTGEFVPCRGFVRTGDSKSLEGNIRRSKRPTEISEGATEYPNVPGHGFDRKPVLELRVVTGPSDWVGASGQMGCSVDRPGHTGKTSLQKMVLTWMPQL